MPVEQDQDKIVQLISPDGIAVDVVDFGTHVEQLKSEWGYSDPAEVATKPKKSAVSNGLEAEYNNKTEQEK